MRRSLSGRLEPEDQMRPPARRGVGFPARDHGRRWRRRPTACGRKPADRPPNGARVLWLCDGKAVPELRHLPPHWLDLGLAEVGAAMCRRAMRTGWITSRRSIAMPTWSLPSAARSRTAAPSSYATRLHRLTHRMARVAPQAGRPATDGGSLARAASLHRCGTRLKPPRGLASHLTQERIRKCTAPRSDAGST